MRYHNQAELAAISCVLRFAMNDGKSIPELREQLAHIYQQQVQLQQRADSENRDLSEDEIEQMNEYTLSLHDALPIDRKSVV